MESQPDITELRKLQLSELNILIEFKRLCEKYALTYYLTAGTLLGAVRHKGFIPWDDDIDIAMPRRDYDRLSALCSEDLDGKYFFQDSFTDKNFPYCFSKIRRNGTEVYEEHLKNVKIHKGQYIDIFPLDVCPRNDTLARSYFKLVTMVICAYMAKVNPDFVCGYRNPFARAALRLLTCLPIGGIRSLRGWVVDLPARIGCKGRLCTVGGAHGCPAETYEAEWFSGTEQMTFENISFNVPSGWDRILSHMYGDYMTLPDRTGRAGHFANRESRENEKSDYIRNV